MDPHTQSKNSNVLNLLLIRPHTTEEFQCFELLIINSNTFWDDNNNIQIDFKPSGLQTQTIELKPSTNEMCSIFQNYSAARKSMCSKSVGPFKFQIRNKINGMVRANCQL